MNEEENKCRGIQQLSLIRLQINRQILNMWPLRNGVCACVCFCLFQRCSFVVFFFFTFIFGGKNSQMCQTWDIKRFYFSFKMIISNRMTNFFKDREREKERIKKKCVDEIIQMVECGIVGVFLYWISHKRLLSFHIECVSYCWCVFRCAIFPTTIIEQNK